MSAPKHDVGRLRDALAQISDDEGWPEAEAERLFSALHGEMEPAQRRLVVDELIRNPRAAAAWRLARELEVPEDVVQTRTAGGSGRWAWMSLAAMLLLTLSGAVWHLQPWRTAAPAYRGGEALAIRSPIDGGALPRERPELRWTVVDGARYHIRVLTPALDLLDEADDLREPRYRLPAHVLDQVGRGGALLWQVEARAPGMDTVISPTFSTVVE